MKARAVVSPRPHVVEWREVEVPSPSSNDVLLRVTHSWISNGTESSMIRGERLAGDTAWCQGDPLPFPFVPGYQKVGVIEWKGDEVRDFEVGDRVFATMSKVEGMFHTAGGHISPAVTTQDQLWKLPTHLTSEEASGLVLTQVGFNTGSRPPLQKGDAAIVLGDGMVGHWTAQTLAYRGAKVLMVGKHDARLRLFSQGTTLNIRQGNLLADARDFAPQGVQVVADTVGDLAATLALLPLMKRDSHISSAGFYGEGGKLDIQLLRNQEITLHAPAGWTKPRMAQTLSLLAAGALQTRSLITHRFAKEDAVEAYKLIFERCDDVLGVILEWDN